MRREEHRTFDVVVVGGGMSGLCAALAAARNGAETALVHARPVLGGNASSEVRVHISSATDGMRKPELEEGGILYELMLANKARNPDFVYSLWDMTLFEAAKMQRGLTLFLNTVMTDCSVENHTVQSIACYQETTEKHLTLSAPLFVDATGNGTLGYFADAEYRQGSEAKSEFGEPHAPEQANNERMGNTILFRAIDRGHPVPFTPPAFAKKLSEHDLRFRVHSNRHRPDFSMAENPEDYARVSATSSSCSDYGYWWIELMGDGEDIIPDYEDIRDELYAYFWGVWDHIKNGGDHGAENYELVWVGALPGMRESRRLVGDYILNECDIAAHRMFDDAVCYGGWGVDLHVAHGLKDLDQLPSRVWNNDGYYTIPYRCFYSRNITNLFLAGRDISCSKLAFASTRIIGTCAIGGQAAGTAAALCHRYGCAPRGLLPRVGELQQLLLKQDCFLPGIRNADEQDLARGTTFTASSHTEGGEPQNVINGISRSFDGVLNGWRSAGISPAGETLCMRLSKPARLSELRLTFDCDFRYPLRITMAPARQKQQRPGVPMELVRDYDIVLMRNRVPLRRISVRGNIQRHNVVAFEPTECDSVEFLFLSTHGAEQVTVFEVRAYETAGQDLH